MNLLLNVYLLCKLVWKYIYLLDKSFMFLAWVAVSDQHYSASFEQNALKIYGQIRDGAGKNWLNYVSLS